MPCRLFKSNKGVREVRCRIQRPLQTLFSFKRESKTFCSSESFYDPHLLQLALRLRAPEKTGGGGSQRVRRDGGGRTGRKASPASRVASPGTGPSGPRVSAQDCRRARGRGRDGEPLARIRDSGSSVLSGVRRAGRKEWNAPKRHDPPRPHLVVLFVRLGPMRGARVPTSMTAGSAAPARAPVPSRLRPA